VRDRGYQVPEIGCKVGCRNNHQFRRPGLTRGPSAHGLGSVGLHDLSGAAPEAAKAWMPGSPATAREGPPPEGGQGIPSDCPAPSIQYAKLLRNRNRAAVVRDGDRGTPAPDLKPDKTGRTGGPRRDLDKAPGANHRSCPPPKGDAATNAGGLLQIRCRCSKINYRASSKGCGAASVSGRSPAVDRCRTWLAPCAGSAPQCCTSAAARRSEMRFAAGQRVLYLRASGLTALRKGSGAINN
jgi:hypothetical protein